MGFLSNLFSNSSAGELKRIQPLVDKITFLRPQMYALTDEQLGAKTQELKERFHNGETLEQLLPEAFAVVREATRRVFDTEHFPVQLMGGIVLHQGRIAEMKTGEGKSQTCYLPAYLNALTGKGVHIVTVNDYLAERDADNARQVMDMLGVSVGCILNDMSTEERQAAYNCDITYITNNELGFDYLRDNMATNPRQRVQRGLEYAIVDEVDSVLIDEARTPLIISGMDNTPTKIYEMADFLAKSLVMGEEKEQSKIDLMVGEQVEENGDFIVNRKEQNVYLTESGVKKTEEFFKIDNLADPKHVQLQHYVTSALRANYLMHKDQQYVVLDGEILIVDEFTGRIMYGRRYNNGLHQAIEAKEHVEIKQESKTLATITFQNFFNKYHKKSGMTGTAKTEETEFQNIYGMDVVEIPTNLPVIRKDLEDAVFKTKAEKYEAVVNAVVEAHEKGQPVLVGTVTIETSELLSRMLKKKGIPHNVLNAKYHEMEAQIVAEAGRHGAVTIATNMAGRGTDIKLDEEARKAGGLKIIGTERHESRRIDNQLRGRSGRQGDPGESKFYISLEDDLMKLFGSERMMTLLQALGVEEGEELNHKSLSKSIERAQKKIENNHYGVRKRLLEYDEIINEQRELIYSERNMVLDGKPMRETILGMIEHLVQRMADINIPDERDKSTWDMNGLANMMKSVFIGSPEIRFVQPDETDSTSEDAAGLIVKLDKSMTKEALVKKLTAYARELYANKEAEFRQERVFRSIERMVILRVVDTFWPSHIDDMDKLRNDIGLVSYGQKDPLTEYRIQGYEMFRNMIAAIEENTIRTMMSMTAIG